MKHVSYFEKLKDPRWQKRRLEIFNRDNFRCCNCDSSSETLTVHHKAYFPGRDPWDYADVFLQTLCKKCHAERSQFLLELLCNFQNNNLQTSDAEEILKALISARSSMNRSDFIEALKNLSLISK